MAAAVIGAVVGDRRNCQFHLRVRGDDQLGRGLGAGVVGVDGRVPVDLRLYPVLAHGAGGRLAVRSVDSRALGIGVKGVGDVIGRWSGVRPDHARNFSGVHRRIHGLCGVGRVDDAVLCFLEFQGDFPGYNGQTRGDRTHHLVVVGARSVIACRQVDILGGKGDLIAGHIDILARCRTGLPGGDGGGQSFVENYAFCHSAGDAALAHRKGGAAAVGHGLARHSDGDGLGRDAAGVLLGFHDCPDSLSVRIGVLCLGTADRVVARLVVFKGNRVRHHDVFAVRGVLVGVRGGNSDFTVVSQEAF